MAAKKDKNDAAVAVQGEVTTAEPIDFSSYMPAGYDASELQRVGGLIPLVPAELAYTTKSNVVGWVFAIIDMPPRPSLKNKGEKEDWQAIWIELTGPTKAQSNDEIIDMKAGDHVMVPVGGSLRNNSQLARAAANPEDIYLGVFRVTGSRDVGRGSDMWDYEVQLHPKARKRVGLELQANRAAAPKGLPAVTESNGSLPSSAS